MSLTSELLTAYKRTVTSFELIPSDGGCFEVTRDGELVFSKLAAGRFPEDGEVKAILDGQRDPVGQP